MSSEFFSLLVLSVDGSLLPGPGRLWIETKNQLLLVTIELLHIWSHEPGCMSLPIPKWDETTKSGG